MKMITMKEKKCKWRYGDRCKRLALPGESFCQRHLEEKINRHKEEFKIILGLERNKKHKEKNHETKQANDC